MGLRPPTRPFINRSVTRFTQPPAAALGVEPDEAVKTCGSGSLKAPTTERAAGYPEPIITMDPDIHRGQDADGHRGPKR